MNQETINREWLAEYSTNVGVCTILTAPKQEGRRITRQDAQELKTALQAVFKAESAKLQCEIAEVRLLKRSVKIHLWALGFRPGFLRDDRGLSEVQWTAFTGLVVDTLRAVVIEPAVYSEPWSAGEKFQLRYDLTLRYEG